MATETELICTDRQLPILPYHEYSFPAEAGRMSALPTLQQKNDSWHRRRQIARRVKVAVRKGKQ
jgi:hypothetical protein